MTELLGHICPNKNIKGVASADMAIQTLKDDNLQLRQKIAFIISDYNMPPGKKTGGDLALYLRTILKDHKMPFILNSGNPAINLEDYDGVIDVFMKKPLKMNEIAPNIINAIKTRILSVLN